MANIRYVFVVFAILWEIAVGLIYGFLLGYDQKTFGVMNKVTKTYLFLSPDASNPTTNLVNSTQYPYPQAVIALAIVILIVGFGMVAGYIERSGVTGMSFTLIIFALTVQNFFIFRDFWHRVGVNNSTPDLNFGTSTYPRINYINIGNDLQISRELPTASFLDAIGCALSIYAGYSAVIGRIGLPEVFFLSWIGAFGYELSSQLLWRLYIVDSGFPVRAFAYGGALGIISSLILAFRNGQKTKLHETYKSNYKFMTISMLGIIFVWCAYPVLILNTSYISQGGRPIAMIGQVNMWLCLAASVLGCFTSCAFAYRKFCVHDIVFGAITGAIAYSSCTDVNYNPGAALAIGYCVGFVCSFTQTRLKRKINEDGVIDSNSVLFNFIIPSLLAAVFSAGLSGLGTSALTSSIRTSNSTVSTSFSFADNRDKSRTYIEQGGYQIIGWLISTVIGILAGLLIGLIYRVLGSSRTREEMFVDRALFDHPRTAGQPEKVNEKHQQQR